MLSCPGSLSKQNKNPLGVCSVSMTMPMAEPKCEMRLIVNHRCAARGWAGPPRGEDSWACTGGTVCAVGLDCHSGADGEMYTQGLKTCRRGDSRETSGERLNRWTEPDFRERNRTSLLSSFAESKYLLLSSGAITGSSEKEQMLQIILTVKLI